MDISIIATIGFTVIAMVGIIVIYVASSGSRGKKE
jgi:hypothetical protein